MGCGVLFKSLLGAVVFLIFIGFFFVEIQVNGVTTLTTTRTKSAKGSMKPLDVKERKEPTTHPGLDLNYMSKRRVPNGPDPIHNRRAGKSTQPPGRA